MKLIVGLGNPGKKYELNRHNIGFLFIDYLIDTLRASKISSKFKGDLFRANDFLLLKPSTFMNLSGESAVLVKNYYKIENENIIVVHDDIDLPLGAIRIKRGGSSGGHNGLKSLDKHIGSDYWRIRIGVGRPENKADVINFVLNDFKKEELECLKNYFPLIEKELENISTKKLTKGC